MATLRDVARKAGVDPSTVSRVVNADRGLAIRDETRRRILAAVRELEYRPNIAARGLRLRSTARTIGCIVADVADPADAQVVAGALEAAGEVGYGLLLARRRAAAGQAEGWICVGPPVETAAPVVSVGGYTRGYFVAPDDARGARSAVDHLIARGHRRIGCLIRRMDSERAFARFDGYRRAMAASGLRVDMRLLGDDPRRLIAAGATAIFAADRVPGPLPVETLAWGVHVQVPWRRLGREAVALLGEVLAGRPPARRGRLVAPLCGPFPGAGIPGATAKRRMIQG